MTDIFLFTFNCAKILHPDFPLFVKPILPSKEPRFFVFGFQELLSIFDSTYPSLISARMNQLKNELKLILDERYGGSFKPVSIEHFGAVGQIVFTNVNVSDVESSNASIGYLQSNLKSAVAVRCKCEDETFTFITAHLSANEGFIEKRNADFWNIVRNLKFKEGLFDIASHTFFQGDLNYRASIINNNEDNDNAGLLEIDELNTVRRQNLAFVGFDEAEIKFKPTYKYKVGTKIYNTKRIPSWCDRILFNSKGKVHEYNSLRSVKSSDHEPVYLHIAVDIPGAPIVQDQKLIVDVPEHLKELRFDGGDYFQRQIGNYVDFAIWLGLWLGLTGPGRATLVIVSVIVLYKVLF